MDNVNPPQLKSRRRKNCKSTLSEMNKNQHNLKTILLYSNSNPIRNKDTLGYRCQFCTEQYSEPKDLKNHFLNEHKIKEVLKVIKNRLFECFVKLDITNLKCTLCNKDISNVECLTEHLKTEHNVEMYTDVKTAIVPFKFETEDLKCAVCSKEYRSFKHLKEHMNTHYGNYICPVCGKGFVTDSLLVKHIKRHKTEGLKCKDCDKVFGTKENLRYHQRRIHLGFNKRNKCMICHERFIDHKQKIRHMVKEHEVPRVILQCDLCERTFDDQARLTTHVKKDHLLERKHKCEECGMLFFTPSALKNHMTKHNGLRQFQCDVCLKAYPLKNTLRVHMRIHANDRRFGCEHCGQAFVQKCSLRSHMRSKHGKDMKS